MTEMNKTQTAHLQGILRQAERLISDKYIKGAAEHQSTLSEDYTAEQLLDMAIEEATDQMVYLLTLKEKMNE